MHKPPAPLSSRPAWIEVDTDEIGYNVQAVRAFVGESTGVMAIVKANAYGHGLVEVARAAVGAGAVMLGVAVLDEAICLREAGVDAPVLILGPVLPGQAEEVVRAGCAQVVSEGGLARALAAAALRHGVQAKTHVKVDTGMGRVGMSLDRAPSFVEEVMGLPGVELEGVMTHFSTADEEELSFAREQMARFQGLLDRLEDAGIRPRWRHAANSGAIVSLPDAHLDLVRSGLLTYGIPPTPGPCSLRMRPALSLKARVTQLRTARKGESISYGRTFVTRRESRLALVPLGYADGYSRGLSNRGEVLVRGSRAPIVGRVCMDQFVVDVTDVEDAQAGDEVVLIGRQNKEEITVWDVAGAMDGIAHEVVAMLGARLPRRYCGVGARGHGGTGEEMRRV